MIFSTTSIRLNDFTTTTKFLILFIPIQSLCLILDYVSLMQTIELPAPFYLKYVHRNRLWVFEPINLISCVSANLYVFEYVEKNYISSAQYILHFILAISFNFYDGICIFPPFHLFCCPLFEGMRDRLLCICLGNDMTIPTFNVSVI